MRQVMPEPVNLAAQLLSLRGLRRSVAGEYGIRQDPLFVEQDLVWVAVDVLRIPAKTISHSG